MGKRKIKTPFEEVHDFAERMADSPKRTYTKTYIHWLEGKYPEEPNPVVLGLTHEGTKKIRSRLSGYRQTLAGYRR